MAGKLISSKRQKAQEWLFFSRAPDQVDRSRGLRRLLRFRVAKLASLIRSREME